MTKKERADKTKAGIIEAAYRTVAECSISGAGMALIAESAKVSKPLLHYHFKTKAALLEQVLEFVLEKLLAIPMENVSRKLGSMEELRAIFQRYRLTMTTEPELLVVFFDFWVKSVNNRGIREIIVRRFDGFRGYLSQVVSEGIERGEFGAERSHVIPPLMLSLLEGASLQLISDPEAFNFDLYQFMALEMITSLTAANRS